MGRASKSAGEPSMKKRKVDREIVAVSEALSMATDIPDVCREMLLASLPHAFGACKTERHHSQLAVIGMIEAVMQETQKKMQAGCDEEIAKTADVEKEKCDLDAAIQRAKEALIEAKDHQKNQVEHEATTRSTLETNSAALLEREAEQVAGDADMNATKAEKAVFDSAFEADLKTIITGESEELATHYENLKPILGQLVLDDSLTLALQSSCVKKASARGGFDAMVLEQVSAQMTTKISELAAKIATETPAAEGRAAAVSEAKAAVESAEAASKQAVEMLEAAKVRVSEAKAAVDSAEEARLVFDPAFVEATKVRDEKMGELDNYKEYHFGNFELLRERVSTQAVAPVGGA